MWDLSGFSCLKGANILMTGAANKYREEVDNQRILRIREICRILPQACGDFLRAIAVTTGTFTRLAYAIDLNTFFQFITNCSKW